MTLKLLKVLFRAVWVGGQERRWYSSCLVTRRREVNSDVTFSRPMTSPDDAVRSRDRLDSENRHSETSERNAAMSSASSRQYYIG